MEFLILVVGIAAAVVFDVLRIKKRNTTALIAKTVASSLFVLLALVCVLKAGQRAGRPERLYVFLVFSLVCGLVGDIMLNLKGIYKEDKNVYFASGMVFFAVGHIVFLIALMLNYQLDTLNVIIPLLTAVALGAAIVLSAPLFSLDYKKFRPLCFIYAVLLAWCLTQSFSAALKTEFEPVFSVLFIASALFACSDLILSHIYFSTKDLSNSTLLSVFTHSTYYAAQYLIALSILLI